MLAGALWGECLLHSVRLFTWGYLRGYVLSCHVGSYSDFLQAVYTFRKWVPCRRSQYGLGEYYLKWSGTHFENRKVCEDVAPLTYPVRLRGALIENDPVVTLWFAKCVRMWYLVLLTVFFKVHLRFWYSLCEISQSVWRHRSWYYTEGVSCVEVSGMAYGNTIESDSVLTLR